jgi:uncharacterized protein YlxW (UPF0749 family)
VTDRDRTNRAAGDRELGGYRPEAGRNSHVADAPVKIPVPSLLRGLLTDHLDPGYRAAAEQKAAGTRRSGALEWGWQLVGGVAVAVVFGVAAVQAQSSQSVTRQSQHVLSASVRSAEVRTQAGTRQRDGLAGEVEQDRRQRLAGDAQGRRLLSELESAEFSAAVTPVTGPGLTVTVTEPGPVRNLTDASKQRVSGSPQIILDRDLQLVVNALWVAGAEAISVGGIRIGPNVTLRQAGGGILVDNQPVGSPYVIVAIGPVHAMADSFDHSPAMKRLTLLSVSYGVGINTTLGDRLSTPPASVRDVNFAKEIGPK